MSGDNRKRLSAARGNLTRVQTQLATQETIGPGDRNLVSLSHLSDLLKRAEESYANAFSTIDEPTTDEEDSYTEFSSNAIEVRSRLSQLSLQTETYSKVRHLNQSISDELDDWEEVEEADLRDTFSESYTRLQAMYVEFKNLVSTPDVDGLDDFRQFAKSYRRRLSELKKTSTPDSESSPDKEKSDTSGAMRQSVKARTVPLPTYNGDLSDWRSFWRRFTEYIGRLHGITTDEKLSYLLDSLKEPAARELVSDAIRNGDTFDEVGDRLNTKYDQPREVLLQAVKNTISASAADYNRSDLILLSKEATRYSNIILRYGDGTAEQLLTAMWENNMTAKLREEWRLYNKSSDVIPSIKHLIKFCDEREKILTTKEKSRDRSAISKTPSKPQPSTNKQIVQPRLGKGGVSLHTSVTLCRVCNTADHPLYLCSVFQGMDVDGRKQVLREQGGCFNCLNHNHSTKNCFSRKTCKECGKRHHTLLHKQEAEPDNTPPTAAPTNQPSLHVLQASDPTDPSSKETPILVTCRVKVEYGSRAVIVRAMVDNGSISSFLSNKVANQLQVQRIPCSSRITTLEGAVSDAGRYRAEVVIKATDDDENSIQLPVLLAKTITEMTPNRDLTKSKDVKLLKSIKLADPNFATPGRIDLLIGQNILRHILRQGYIPVPNSNLYAINTVFGWALGGCCSNDTESVSSQICFHTNITNSTDELLQAFWKTEEPPISGKVLSEEEKQAVTHFQSTVTRQEDGRYQVRLPKKTTTLKLGHSRTQAIRRFNSNKQSLMRQHKWDEFAEAISEYGKMGHAEPVPLTELGKPDTDVYYLPMHGVSKETSTTTKLRVVFDASARTSSGCSLNDVLLPGPTLYPLLTSTLLKFRQHKIGLSADVSKMFREVALHPDDRDLHRYVISNEHNQFQDMRMTRVTFGVTSSPFLATQVLRKLAFDHAAEFPEAASVVLSSFYVDDCLSGADSLEDATHLRLTLNQLLDKGKMTLRKWRSNSTELKQQIPEHLLEKDEVQLIAAPADCHKTLGVHWDTARDTLHVATPELNQQDRPTKRQVLSDIARTFDVLGMFGPVTVTLKILLQSLWRLQLNWDDLLPPNLAEVWTSWRAELHLITQHPIKRCYHLTDLTVQSLQLHGFCDASETAFAGVVYVRFMYTNTTVSVSLVLSKTRVAPVKTQTIPKLELCSATLLSKLLATVAEELNVSMENVYAWTDSMISLGWLRTPPHKLKTYVANRVVNTTDQVPSSRWKYIPSKDNPADLGSRGTSVSQLVQSDLWWNGPTWLQEPPNCWPMETVDQYYTRLPEMKSSAVVMKVDVTSKFNLINRYSNYTKLTHVVAWLFRFVNKAQKKLNLPHTHFLTVEEVQAAERVLFCLHQKEYFPREQAQLRDGTTVSPSSPLHKLHPIIDSQGLVRVGGRLLKSGLTYGQMHPIILHHRSQLVKLLVRLYHIKYLHAGPTLLMGLIAREFHIVGARRLIRSVSHSCVPCQREYARTSKQLMGELPSARVRPSSPFTRVGMDFAGPVTLRRGHTRKPSMVKAYICLFVCLATKATHLELVSDLSTEAFLAAFSRFTARRGCPEEVLSDNGTNFVGANHELGRLYELLTKRNHNNQLCQYFTNHRIKWSFTPSRAPHFGGLWEAGVKSAKTILRKTIGTHPMTVDEYATVLTQVEAILNSRPLCKLEAPPEDGLEVLTPGHFLIGRPLLAPPQPADDHPMTTYKRWNLCRRMANEFWRRWSTEYLQLLQKRHKWGSHEPNLNIGDIVMIKDQVLFMRTWPLAIIEEVHPGPDQRVRAVTVRTSKGIYRRPINKLVPLVTKEKEDSTPILPSRRGEDVQATYQDSFRKT